ncbi:MAG: hypothetical protein LBD60_01065 [Puniceicoccales bacterium]|jgi:hypothetical protein|nr:hypothetical protein [Puniceicoccales bacterium]
MNTQEFTNSAREGFKILKTSEGVETMRRISFVQKLQNQVSELKSKTAALREKIDSNHHLREEFSKTLASMEKDVIGEERNLNTLLYLFMNNRGHLKEAAKEKIEIATSQSLINKLENALITFSNEFKPLEQECLRRIANIENRAQQVLENPLRALEEAILYLDRGDTTLSDEAYKKHPGLVAENIIAAGIALFDKAPIVRNSREGKALHQLIEHFSQWVPREFETAKGGKEFLEKLKKYCQTRAKPLEEKINSTEETLNSLRAEVRVIQSQIERGPSTVTGKIAAVLDMKSNPLIRLQNQKKALEDKIQDIAKAAAISISGKNGHGGPAYTFTQLKRELTKLNGAKTAIERALANIKH